MFTPTNSNPKKYKNVVVGKAPTETMNPKMTCEVKEDDKPEEGKTYSLTGLGKCIANGNTWKESEVK